MSVLLSPGVGTTSVSFLGVPPQDLGRAWPHVKEFIELALARTAMGALFAEKDIYNQVLQQEMQLWVVLVGGEMLGAFTTQVIIYPKARVLDIPLLGGERYEEWEVSVAETVKGLARSANCSLIRGYGRIGWAKKLKSHGLRPSLYFDVPIGEHDETIH